jgi:hypothetical protein
MLKTMGELEQSYRDVDISDLGTSIIFQREPASGGSRMIFVLTGELEPEANRTNPKG